MKGRVLPVAYLGGDTATERVLMDIVKNGERVIIRFQEFSFGGLLEKGTGAGFLDIYATRVGT